MHKSKVDLYLKANAHDARVYDYYSYNLEQLKKRYKWHAFASTAIFWVVLIIVFSGIIFSGIQFYIGLKRVKGKPVPAKGKAKQAEEPGENTDTTSTETSVKISPEGLEVKSSILGVIILVISIAFFYLYLTIVYPMKDAPENNVNFSQPDSVIRSTTLKKPVDSAKNNEAAKITDTSKLNKTK
jgi:hypothetical protein